MAGSASDAEASLPEGPPATPADVRIPTFGSFSMASEGVEAEDGTVTLQWPAFRLARNLVGSHNLMEREECPTGHKEVEPLKYAEVAAAASVTWQTGTACIFDTTSLVFHCLRKGENIAFVLKDIGVLLIEEMRVQMKFYYDFLERINGKESLEKVVLKVPWLLDMVVSRVAAVASLTSSGDPSQQKGQLEPWLTPCLLLFYRFKREFVPKPPPGKPRRASKVPVPPLGQDKKEECPELPPLPSWIHVTFLVEKPPEEKKTKKTSNVQKKASQLPAIPEASSAKKKPQKKKAAKSCTESKAVTEMGPAQAAQAPSDKEEQHSVLSVVKATTGGGVPEKAQAKAKPRSHHGAPAVQQTPLAALWSRSSETSLLEERTHNASPAVPLTHKGTRPRQGQPPKSRAGLPGWEMSCPR
ncbi:uncharacterized protein LOC109370442 [Meleagris gallopavo]|uniref:uncharacterized protein LOC109370442 n=1 Tax=Meleagris gallopavo TaxID=9103 RepID=UPI0012AB6DE3|nr:uncharacterized protein LOC109370442 [Meleagris gallopavo]